MKKYRQKDTTMGERGPNQTGLRRPVGKDIRLRPITLNELKLNQTVFAVLRSGILRVNVADGIAKSYRLLDGFKYFELKEIQYLEENELNKYHRDPAAVY
ncbi:hypothetical protein M513_00522 [Trichuris suis]|uniref:Uncharacterized protein n=1 Tax=Trichuris suis TaxID=68888 RepID=A0A085MNN3_9BILA|nr:hypothetical protein M513_00522 [Trichuris suis]